MLWIGLLMQNKRKRKHETKRSKNQVFCTATSSLAPRTAECARLLREQGLGLGQLFRHLKVHPDFKLLEVGKTPHKVRSKLMLSIQSSMVRVCG